MSLNLDLKDRKLLYQLDIDCRQTNSEIGKKVGLSKQVVDYRIKRFLKEGIIPRFATVVDTYKLGFSKYKIYLSLENASKEVIKQMIDFLKSHDKTEWIATCSGRWDIIAGYIVKDIYEFNDAVKELDEKFSQHISTREIIVGLGVPHWRKEYLLNNKEPHKVIFQGGQRGNYKIDKTDEEILKLLVNNARMPLTEIAQRLKTTPRVINYRIKILKKDKIILINRIFLDLNKFNWIYCKALLKFKNLTNQKYKQFFQYCNSINDLTYMINSIGSWDLEMDFEIEDFNKFNKIMLEIRDKFSDIIKHYDFVIVMNEDKLDYYPGCYSQFK
ncbi:winged helix-turn-helix transcriptional regulator [Candidatus Woesearchaeota archaeon]|nr:winged helix-turn-helix transcriptional regulator [Candidatus Woesearchaeota archaeon]